MKLFFSFAVIVFIALGISSAAPIPKELKTANDHESIVGNWKCESLSSHGRPQQNVENIVFQFTAKGTCGNTPYAVEPNATYTLDQSETPRRLKWVAPPNTVWQCVYQLDGDKLTLAFVEANTELPKKIEPAKNLTVYTFSRIKQ
jgi:uncharacterized protein (TIGR03067 family)